SPVAKADRGSRSVPAHSRMAGSLRDLKMKESLHLRILTNSLCAAVGTVPAPERRGQIVWQSRGGRGSPGLRANESDDLRRCFRVPLHEQRSEERRGGKGCGW